ncbi:hypothetical protein C8J57DRAFT_1466649 [Mycena rebaudengoi]|nr:hypothetical protein C8J57DRAFT_1466649 [Mycena rebaudengoi]
MAGRRHEGRQKTGRKRRVQERIGGSEEKVQTRQKSGRKGKATPPKSRKNAGRSEDRRSTHKKISRGEQAPRENRRALRRRHVAARAHAGHNLKVNLPSLRCARRQEELSRRLCCVDMKRRDRRGRGRAWKGREAVGGGEQDNGRLNKEEHPVSRKWKWKAGEKRKRARRDGRVKCKFPKSEPSLALPDRLASPSPGAADKHEQDMCRR